jgi:GDPmannose 4,6-dehydratase
VAGYDLTRYYRERTDNPLFACSGILFNHESPRRGREFVTRKITYTAAQIKLGLADKLVLGNPDANRDWGYAPDYVRAMWMMLQQAQPFDYVIATGQTHSVKEFATSAFHRLGLDPEKHIVWNDRTNLRPAEVDLLIGNASQARFVLGWQPTLSFDSLVGLMVESDMALVSKNKK